MGYAKESVKILLALSDVYVPMGSNLVPINLHVLISTNVKLKVIFVELVVIVPIIMAHSIAPVTMGSKKEPMELVKISMNVHFGNHVNTIVAIQ